MLLTYAQGRAKQSKQICVDVLRQLGCSLPKRCRALFALNGIMQTKTLAKRQTVKEFTNLKPMSDPHKIWTMSLLDKLVPYAYNTESGLVPLAILR
jgi:hypothetical protein